MQHPSPPRCLFRSGPAAKGPIGGTSLMAALRCTWEPPPRDNDRRLREPTDAMIEMSRRPVHRSAGGGLVLILALFLPGLGISAQARDTIRVDTTQADTTRPQLFQLEGLTVLVPRPVSTTGGASAVEVSLDSMVMMPAPTLEQVLREMPLVQIRRNSRGEAQPALRGGEDRQIAIMVDGVPLTLGWDHRTDLSVIPLTAAQRISLIRGLSSVLHGPNVLSGVVEIDLARGADLQRPPRPIQIDLGADQTGARSLGLSGGTFVETSGGDWVLRAGIGHQARDGFVLPGGAGEGDGQDPDLLSKDGELRLNTDAERYDGFASARYLARGGTWFSFSTSGFSSERGVAPEAHVEDPRLWRYPDQKRIITAVSGGTGQRYTPWGEGDLEASVGLDLGTYEIAKYATPSYRTVTGTEEADDRTVTVRLMADHNLGQGGELRTAWTYADVSHEEFLDGGPKTTYRQRLWSFGAEGEWRFGKLFGIPATTGTRLTLGAALDGADTPETGDKPPLDRLWDWGVRAGFTSLLSGGTNLIHGAISRRTRFPALRELYSGALGRFVPNPDLRPEILSAGELGVTVTGAHGELQVVGFHQVLSDGIVRTSVSTEEGRKFQRVNRDEVRSTGLEMLTSVTLGGWLLSGDLTVQDVKGSLPDGEELELEYEPTITGRIGTTVPLPLEASVTANFRFVGSQLCENPELGGLQSMDAHRTVDLGFRRGFSFGDNALSRAEAIVSLDNVSDGVHLDQCGLPQPGRTLRFQIRLW